MGKYILHLGSNIGDRQKNLETAISQIEDRVGAIIMQSGIYETEPWGFDADDLFLNQAIKVDSGLDSETVLDILLSIEKGMGRERVSGDYASRIMDIDILFHDDETLETENLVIPHPHIQSRRFVLAPLMDIAEEWIHPNFNKTITELYNLCTDDSKVYLFV